VPSKPLPQALEVAASSGGGGQRLLEVAANSGRQSKGLEVAVSSEDGGRL